METIRETLLPDAVIAYEGFPRLVGRDAFIDLFAQMGCQPGLFDIHHGANGIIRLDGPDSASGQWSLLFHNIDLRVRRLTQMGVEYDDQYVRRDGRWWIAETRSRRLSCVIHEVDGQGAPTITVMGDAPEHFG